MEDVIDKFWSESNIKGRRVEMDFRSVCDDGQVLSRDLVHAANDSWWHESETWEALALLVRAAAVYSTVRKS